MKTTKRVIREIPKKRARGLPLSPLRPVIVITETGPTEFSIEAISAEVIGCKAYGLASLPLEWVPPPFFIISARCFEEHHQDAKIDAWIADCLARTGIDTSKFVYVRSSGTSETMRNRGRLKSNTCPPDLVSSTIRHLIPQLPHMPSGKVHWIVQEYVTPKRIGHLSNERHLRKEKRDWVVAFELDDNRRGRTESLAVRQWRDGTDLPDPNLSCTSEIAVSLRLKNVAMWATRLSSRMHFEWIWDGNTIHIVQADVAEPLQGVNPHSLLPTHIISIQPACTKIFHSANDEDYERYRKLRNAKLYIELGYIMPEFYVLNDPTVINNILSGQIPTELKDELVELTKRPLVIRTDGLYIPEDKREMLPRSEELRSYAQAVDWLLTGLKSKIEESSLNHSDICLIAHHFIPSIASAWARAIPRDRVVRIESLWGIPEGLYWYSHDTYEVDTQNININPIPSSDPLIYRYWERLRYKGTFIGPDNNGNWIPVQTRPPSDWGSSISRQSWLFEIARTTRLVAEREMHAVSVMWFIGNHRQATEHSVLPWFHNKSEMTGSPKAAPRHKRSFSRDFSIKRVEDWLQLNKDLRSGKHIERVIVEPIDPELVRNPIFAHELAHLAKSYKFVVELAGGILSHPYYVLQREGAQVECVDLFGADEDVDEYNKIVRDNVPSIIENRGEHTETVQLVGDALITALRQKLVEEAFEALDAKSGPDLISELADIQEVVRALCRALEVSANDIDVEREEKKKRRGGFDKGLMLIKTTTPHSIQKQTDTLEPPTLELHEQLPVEPVISDPINLPVKPLYRRPDLRQINEQIEKLLTFETEINRVLDIKKTLNFSFPMENHRQENFTLTIEFRRIRSSVRSIVRLSLRRPVQLTLNFPE